ncbi:MAG TPA: undecaprenyl-phosphate glucose phosphotransferase, partial [Xanthobacteraceae bacterium]|nr:undecaprenyl-phosphate glucose phosphotransferase [Xanthobacteraceae bacterium]
FSFRPHVRRSLDLWHLTFLCLLSIGFLTKMTDVYSRGATILFYIAGFPALVLTRYALVSAVAAGSRIGLVTAQRVFLVGASGEIIKFLRRHQPWSRGLHVVGTAPLTVAPAGAPDTVRAEQLRADLAQAIDAARSLAPDAVFVIVPWSDNVTIDRCVGELLTIPAEIHLGPERILERFENVRISRLGQITSLQLTRQPLSPFEVLQKRALDLVVASGILVALVPLLLCVALLIRLDSRGPVFFLQRRYGFNQQPFRIIKFRTMTATDDGDAIVQATRADGRVTRVGRWLRRSSIDELPQLINVIKGDMSLVGPRPHALSHNREYEQKISLYARRHNVKPGITGWAQVNGLRGETDTDDKMRRRVEHDLYYIDNWSLWLDVRILLLTALSRRSHRNAH